MSITQIFTGHYHKTYTGLLFNNVFAILFLFGIVSACFFGFTGGWPPEAVRTAFFAGGTLSILTDIFFLHRRRRLATPFFIRCKKARRHGYVAWGSFHRLECDEAIEEMNRAIREGRKGPENTVYGEEGDTATMAASALIRRMADREPQRCKALRIRIEVAEVLPGGQLAWVSHSTSLAL